MINEIGRMLRPSLEGHMSGDLAQHELLVKIQTFLREADDHEIKKLDVVVDVFLSLLDKKT